MAPSKKGLIKPFNLDPHEYDTMFNASPPDSITISVYLARMPQACPECVEEKCGDIHRKFLALVSKFPAEAASFGISAAVTIDHGLDLDSSCRWLLDIPWGRDWAVEGLYIQIGFFNPTLAGSTDPTDAILAAMHNIDGRIAASRTTDPARHKPLPAHQALADEFAGVVEDVYRNRVGVWCQSLVDFRVMMMIKTRALLLDRDPDQEYNQYVNACGLSLVDYLRLCP